MTRKSTLITIGLAVVIAAGVWIILQQTSPAPTKQTEQNNKPDTRSYSTIADAVAAANTPKVDYSDPRTPPADTKTYELGVKDDKLISGPSEIHADLKSGVFMNFTIYGDEAEYDVFIDEYNSGGEVDDEGGPGKTVGQMYVWATKAGKFTYGIESDRDGHEHKLGTLIVE